MGKAAGTKRRSKKQFRYNVNRKNLQKKSHKMPTIRNPLIKLAYAENKGVRKNFRSMGLSNDPNRTIRIPSAQELLEQTYMPKKTKKIPSRVDPPPTTSKVRGTQKKAPQTVANELEELASKRKDSTFHVSNEIALFAKYMTGKYGDDYKMMARDIRNHYQLTPYQIKRKIEDYNCSQLIVAMRIVNKESS